KIADPGDPLPQSTCPRRPAVPTTLTCQKLPQLAITTPASAADKIADPGDPLPQSTCPRRPAVPTTLTCQKLPQLA
ncbi:hypothetical protein ACNQS2_11415, partial [Corynebacterium diphtheriae]